MLPFNGACESLSLSPPLNHHLKFGIVQHKDNKYQTERAILIFRKGVLIPDMYILGDIRTILRQKDANQCLR